MIRCTWIEGFEVGFHVEIHLIVWLDICWIDCKSTHMLIYVDIMIIVMDLI